RWTSITRTGRPASAPVSTSPARISLDFSISAVHAGFGHDLGAQAGAGVVEGGQSPACAALKRPLLLGEVPDGAQGPWSSGSARVTVIRSSASGPARVRGTAVVSGVWRRGRCWGL